MYEICKRETRCELPKESIGVLEKEVIELEENKIKIEINGYIKVCTKQSGRLQLLPAIKS